VLAIPASPDMGEHELPTVVEGAAETALAYALLRRTLSNLDARDRFPSLSHLELLIDRFGYIRARWPPGERQSWTQIDLLIAQAQALQREPMVKPPPDDHVY
jgi:putative copper resistance protein D